LADDAQVVVRGQTALTPGQALPARSPAAALTPPSTSAR
jgi:hypothetical protein